MPRSRRPYGKTISSPTNKDHNTESTTKSQEQGNIVSKSKKLGSSNKTSSRFAQQPESPSLPLQSASSTITTRKPNVKIRRKQALRETTNLYPKLSTDTRNDTVIQSNEVKKKKQASSGDEITPRASNCNKIKQQHRSFDETQLYSQYAGDESSTPNCKSSSNSIQQRVKGDDEQSREHESDMSAMDCSSDSLGLESPNDQKLEHTMKSETMDVLETENSEEHDIACNKAKESDLPDGTSRHVEEIHFDSKLVDSNGYPTVSKGLMKRALAVKADNENVLHVLMSSCGGRNTKRRNHLMQSSASSIQSHYTLESSTLLGATIPVRRCDSFDSTLTCDTFAKYEHEQLNDEDDDNPTIKNVCADMKRYLAASGGTSYATQNKIIGNTSESDLNEKFNGCKVSSDLLSEDPRPKKDTEQEDGTVQTIDTENRSVVTHPQLPPGWKVKVSRSKNQVYYVHPDFGSTWHCPVVTQKPIEIKKLDSQTESLHLKATKNAKVNMEEGQHNKSVSKGKYMCSELNSEQSPFVTETYSKNDFFHDGHIPAEEKASAIQENKDVVFAQKQHRKFEIYKDPPSTIEKASKVSLQEQNGSGDTQSHEKMAPVLILPRKSQMTNTKDINADKKFSFDSDKNASFSIDGGTTMSSDREDCRISLHNEQSASEESSISHADDSPRFLDFSNEIESENVEDIFSDGSDNGNHLSEKNSEDESRPNCPTSSRSSNLSHSSSSDTSECDDYDVTRMRDIQENSSHQPEKLADRLARLRHPLCSLQYLNQIARENLVRKRSSSFQSSSCRDSRKKKVDKIRVSYGKK